MVEAVEHLGTAARSWLRRAATALAGAVLLVGLAQLPAAPPARAAASSGTGRAEVQVDSLTPAAPKPGDTLEISGTVANNSGQTLTAAHVGLRIATKSPLASLSDIDDMPAGGGFSPASDGSEIADHTVRLPDIAARSTAPFTLDVPVEALHLGGNGVYQLGIAASGQSGGADYQQVVGIARTFLPWFPQGGGEKTRTTFLWPLIDRSHLDTRTPGDGQQAPLLRDDDLAAELAPGGRLQQMISLGKGLPVTWVIDPDLLATVDAMTRPYQVDGPNGDATHTTPGTGTAYALQWLSGLQNAVRGNEVIALPFADPDIASIAHHGRSVPGTIDRLRAATDLSSATVQTILGVTPRTDFAWPADGAVDPAIVSTATAAGADKIIARSDSLRETGGLSYTPSAARPIGTGTTAVVADADLSKALTTDLTRAGDFTQAVQRFLAQSLMINEQAPRKQRDVLIAPQRMPTTSQAQAMAAALAAMSASGWSQPVSLGFEATDTPDPSANRTVPASNAYPRSLLAKELSTADFQQIQSVQDSLNGFQVILSRKDRVTSPFGTAMMRSTSTQWRGDAAGLGAFLNSVADYLGELTRAVHIVDKQSITLSGRSATIPVTVQNNLAQQVGGLQLRLTSNQSNRLDPGPPQPVDIDGGHNRSLKFSASSGANGRVWVTAQLYTVDGRPYGGPVVFQINVTSLTATVMLVIGGGLLLLALAGVRMYGQRKRAAARRTGEGHDGGENAGPGDGPDRPAAAYR